MEMCRYIALTSLVIVTLSGCSIHSMQYQNFGHATYQYGYKTKKIGDLSYKISFDGMAIGNNKNINTYLKRRSGEVCGFRNYEITEKNNTSSSRMMMAGSTFVDLTHPVKEAIVKCKSTRDAYYSNLMAANKEWCYLTVFYTDRLVVMTDPGLATITINGTEFVSLPLDGYARLPAYIGENKIEVSSPFNESSPEIERKVNISTCEEHAQVSINFSGTRELVLYSNKPEGFGTKYKDMFNKF